MNDDTPLTSRRAGLAGAAALLVTALSRSAAADGAVAPAQVPPPNCCGNGPPNIAQYGVGIEPILQSAGPNVLFNNALWGTPMADVTQGQFYYVFVPRTDVIVTSYTAPDGTSHKPKHYTVTGYSGIVYRIEPGFQLGLEWPDGVTPDFSTRPLGKTEGAL